MTDEVMEPGNGEEVDPGPHPPASDDQPGDTEPTEGEPAEEATNGEEEVANVLDAPEAQVVYDSEAEAQNVQSPAADDDEAMPDDGEGE